MLSYKRCYKFTQATNNNISLSVAGQDNRCEMYVCMSTYRLVFLHKNLIRHSSASHELETCQYCTRPRLFGANSTETGYMLVRW